MSDAVLTALIMTAGTIICQILINRSNREKREKDEAFWAEAEEMGGLLFSAVFGKRFHRYFFIFI